MMEAPFDATKSFAALSKCSTLTAEPAIPAAPVNLATALYNATATKPS